MRTSVQIDGPGEVLIFGQNRHLFVGLQELEGTIAEEKTGHRATRIHFDVLQSLGRVRFQQEGSSGGVRFGLPGQDSTWFSDAHRPPFSWLARTLRLFLGLGQTFAELVQKSAVDIVQTVVATRHRKRVRWSRVERIWRPMVLCFECAVVQPSDAPSIPNSVWDFR